MSVSPVGVPVRLYTADTPDIGIVHAPEPVEPDDLVALEHGPPLRIICVVRLGPRPVPYLAEVERDEPRGGG